MRQSIPNVLAASASSEYDASPAKFAAPTFADEVRALRESLGLSQVEFAQMYDIPVSNLRNWEQTSRKTYPDSAARLLISMIKLDPKKVAELVELGRQTKPAG
jgi:putative transcriptional regulator